MRKLNSILTITFLITSLATPVQAFEYAGMFKIPEKNIYIELYRANSVEYTREEMQPIVDSDGKGIILDSSQYYGRPVAQLIADHKNQGFEQIYGVVVGETVADFETENGTIISYVCQGIDSNGSNDDHFIYDSSGESAVLKVPEDWLIVYTCNPIGWWSVTLTYWEPVLCIE